MNPRLTIVAVAALLLPATARAEVTFAARPEIGVQTGYETFELEYAVPNQSATTLTTLSSELTYPLHTTIAGVSAAVDADSIAWLASVHTNLHDPWGKMVDSDSVSFGSPGSPTRSTEFSRTESREKARLWSAELALAIRVAQLTPDVRARFLAGFRYESNSYELHGANGWQLDDRGNYVAIALPDDLVVLEYDTRYRIPFVGARLDGNFTEAFALVAETRLLTSFSSHDDDHVLRFKRARATPFGLGFMFRATPMLRVATNMYLGLDLQLQYLHAVTGKLSQRYYEDDPFLGGDQTGASIPDTDFTYRYLRGRFLAVAEIRF